MPQFDPSTFPSQLLWMLVCLVVLFVMISRFAIPRLSEVLEKRQRMIDDDLEQAERLKGQTESAIAVYEAALADARGQAQQSIRSVSDAASKEAERRTAEVNARLNAQIKDGEAKIAHLREEALANVRAVAAEVSVGVVERLAGQSRVDAAKAQSAVEAVMREQGR